MSEKLSARMSGTADFWDCEDHIALSDGAKHLRDYSIEVSALEAERDALVAKLERALAESTYAELEKYDRADEHLAGFIEARREELLP